jgi:agmatinase
MTTSFENHTFGSRGTFAGVPKADLDDLGHAGAVIVGAPFDWGTTYRPGARFGPKAIREIDPINRSGQRPRLETGVDALEVLGVVDIGDVDIPPGYVEESLDKITEVVERIATGGAVPIVLGGDHTITFADASGVARVHGPGRVALIHFDAHADTAVTHYGMLHGHGTPMRRLIESGLVPGHRFVQIGLRGYWPPPEIVAWMVDQDMRWHTMSEIRTRGLDAVIDDAVGHAADGTAGVFVSVDIDVVDPSAAPGTGAPEPGGLGAGELLDSLRRIGRELPIVGADIVEVAPVYDGPGEITSLLANRVVLEILNGMAERRLAEDQIT